MKFIPKQDLPEWRDFNHLAWVREVVWQRAYGKCEECQESIGLLFHHRSYTRVPYEQPDDLVLLCLQCHGESHPSRLYDRLKSPSGRFKTTLERVRWYKGYQRGIAMRDYYRSKRGERGRGGKGGSE